MLKPNYVDTKSIPIMKPNNKEFDHWWQMDGNWVEPPNQRRGGTSGVQRVLSSEPIPVTLYIKRQHNHTFRSLRHPFGAPTAIREQNAIQAIDALGIRVPKIRFFGTRREKKQWQSLLVTEALEGYISLEDWLKNLDPAIDNSAERHKVITAIAATLKTLHRGRWIHGCCYPKHIFIKWRENGEPDIALLDLEKARQRRLIKKYARKEVDQFFRHCPAWRSDEQKLFLNRYHQ